MYPLYYLEEMDSLESFRIGSASGPTLVISECVTLRHAIKFYFKYRTNLHRYNKSSKWPFTIWKKTNIFLRIRYSYLISHFSTFYDK